MNRSVLFFMLCLAVCIVSSTSASAMIRTLPVSELVSRSDYIVIGEVRQKKIIGAHSPQNRTRRYLNNYVVVTEQLKGTWPPDKPMIFRTVGAGHWIEDNVEFPSTGTRVLLFVRKNASAGLGLVNGIQGLWPLQDGKPLRMGTGKAIDEIRALIEKQAR